MPLQDRHKALSLPVLFLRESKCLSASPTSMLTEKHSFPEVPQGAGILLESMVFQEM
jgi:hypothetical protein